MTGSVPDLRTNSRPLPFSRSSHALSARSLFIAERFAPAQPDIFQELRRGLENMRGLARGTAFFGEHGKHLERGDQSVAGGDEIAEDDVAGLFAADIEAASRIFSMT